LIPLEPPVDPAGDRGIAMAITDEGGVAPARLPCRDLAPAAHKTVRIVPYVSSILNGLALLRSFRSANRTPPASNGHSGRSCNGSETYRKSNGQFELKSNAE
jgi:hypothetical protein